MYKPLPDSITFTEEQEANEHIRYNHIICTTPVGKFSIEWKGWKEDDSPTIEPLLDIDFPFFFHCGWDVSECKEELIKHLTLVRDNLTKALDAYEGDTNGN